MRNTSNMPASHWLRLAVITAPLALIGACVNDSGPPLSSTILAEAVIHDDLPSDGCSYPVTIGDKDFAPDADSVAKIRARNLPIGSSTVEISYRPTGRTGTVTCGGLSNMRELPEITLYFEGP